MTNFHQILEECKEDLEILRQNRLLDEGNFIKFAKDHGVPVSGVIKGDPGDFHGRRWLLNDDLDNRGNLLFHPFRILTLHKILESCKLNIALSSTLQRDTFFDFIKKVISHSYTDEKIGEMAHQTEKIANLAILLEPIYWPGITGRFSMRGGMEEGEYKSRLAIHRKKILSLVKSLDPTMWHKIHESLRYDAASLDANDSIYLMLRLCNWSDREKLKGSIAGALWLRHIAEIIRRAFEETTTEKWLEEDISFGIWPQGGRTIQYGSERPLDDELKSKPYLALHHGLFTGSTVRWYVEGDTEYYAISHVILDPPKSGIELVNLHGNIESGKNNIALKLRNCLEEDMALRRFSMISFDTDVPANVKFVRRQVEQSNIVGFIAAHTPDFEFSNFAIEELVEVAAKIDEANGVSGDVVRNEKWNGITSCRAFEVRYIEVAARRPRAIKGKEWGEALASYAIDHPNRIDTGAERHFWREIRAALQGRVASYDFQKMHFTFEPNNFELMSQESMKKCPTSP